MIEKPILEYKTKKATECARSARLLPARFVCDKGCSADLDDAAHRARIAYLEGRLAEVRLCFSFHRVFVPTEPLRCSNKLGIFILVQLVDISFRECSVLDELLSTMPLV